MGVSHMDAPPDLLRWFTAQNTKKAERIHKMKEDREWNEYLNKLYRKDAATKIQAALRMMMEKARYTIKRLTQG